MDCLPFCCSILEQSMHPAPILVIKLQVSGWFCRPVVLELAPWIMSKMLSILECPGINYPIGWSRVWNILFNTVNLKAGHCSRISLFLLLWFYCWWCTQNPWNQMLRFCIGEYWWKLIRECSRIVEKFLKPIPALLRVDSFYSWDTREPLVIKKMPNM